MTLHVIGQRDSVLDSQLRPRSDGEVRGMGGVSGQDGLAVIPALIRNGAEIQPLSVRFARCLPDQLMAVQGAFEDLLQKGKAVFVRHRVETEASPCFSWALNDERARPGADAVGVSPYPAAIRMDEGKCKRLENLVRSQPDVLIPA